MEDLQDLLKIPHFRRSIGECAKAVREFGVDPLAMIGHPDERLWGNTMNCMVCITSIQVPSLSRASSTTTTLQIALTDLLKAMGVQPDGIIGHSTGEMACAYADGCLTLEQTMKLAYWRGASARRIALIIRDDHHRGRPHLGRHGGDRRLVVGGARASPGRHHGRMPQRGRLGDRERRVARRRGVRR